MQNTLTIVGAPNAVARTHAAEKALRELVAEGVRPVWVFPTQSEALATKKRLADKGMGMLGVRIETLEAWVRERWRLYGDGREPVTSLQRNLMCRKALRDRSLPGDPLRAKGMVGCLAGIAKDAAGLDVFLKKECLANKLSTAQLDLVGALEAYRTSLRTRGLVETADAAAHLARTMPDAGWQHLVLDGCWNLDGSWLDLVGAAAEKHGVTVCACTDDNPSFEVERTALNRLVTKCVERSVTVQRTACKPLCEPSKPREIADLTLHLFETGCTAPVAAEGHVRMCLPAGRYARPTLLARQIQSLVQKDGIAPRDIVVAAKEPLALAQSVADRLAECPGRGIAVTARGKVSIVSTDVGRYALNWAVLLEAAQTCPDAPRPDLRAIASDLARNPLMGIKTMQVTKMDERWRMNRSTTARRMVDDLLEESPRPAESLAAVMDDLPNHLGAWMDLDGIVERGAADAARDMVAEYLNTFGRYPDAEDLEEAFQWVEIKKCLLSVPSNDIAAQTDARVLQSNPNAVRFVRLSDLAATRCRALVVCDLTAEGYPVSDRADVRSRLWDALGLEPAPTTLANLRRQLRCALEAAGEVLVLERLLNNEDAQPQRPCALLEEVLDCYRVDPSDLGGLDKTTGLPKEAPIPFMTLGEEAFSQLASTVTYAPALIQAPVPTLLPTDPALTALIAPRDHVWSPSDLEALVSCPCRWLYERRLPSRGIDAGFDALARGNLCHLVLQSFHERMMPELGLARIAPDTPEELWRPLFDQCFEEALLNRDSDTCRLVAVTELERRKLEGIRRRLCECVARDALLPEGFVPSRHELRFGFDENEDVRIGGVRVHGVIDRLDVDTSRNLALVIDYKGRLGEGHKPTCQPSDPCEQQRDPLPQHSQILMYLSALRQTNPDLTLAGGLYVSYDERAASGFLDPTVLGPLPDEKDVYLGRSSCSVAPAFNGTSGLEELLGLLDDAVAASVENLENGNLQALPRFGAQSCKYCTVRSCPRREE